MMRYELRPKVILLGIFITISPFIMMDVLSAYLYLEHGSYINDFHVPSIFIIIANGESVIWEEIILGKLIVVYLLSFIGLMQTCLVGLSVITFGLVSIKRNTAFKIILSVAGLWTVIYFGIAHDACSFTFAFDLIGHPHCDEMISDRLAPN